VEGRSPARSQFSGHSGLFVKEIIIDPMISFTALHLGFHKRPDVLEGWMQHRRTHPSMILSSLADGDSAARDFRPG
jgi:hypothetical protein